MARWVSIKGPPSWELPVWPACPGPSLPTANGGWPSLSFLPLWLKGAWQPRMAIMTLLPSVPFHSVGKRFGQQGSGKMFLDPDRGSCLAQPVDLAALRLGGGFLQGWSVGAVWRQQPPARDGPMARRQAAGQNSRRCSHSGSCTLVPHLPPSHSSTVRQAWICDFAV